jgi:hypothetical protein
VRRPSFPSLAAVAAVALTVSAVPVAVADAHPATDTTAAAHPAAAQTPTPKGYRRATHGERVAMTRTARTYAGADGRIGRTTAAFVGVKDPSYGFVCLAEHFDGGTDVIGVGVRPKAAGGWKLWDMDSGSMQHYAADCNA